MKRWRRVLAGVLLIALTFISVRTAQSQSAFDPLPQLAGSAPSVPDVPLPAYVEEATEQAKQTLLVNFRVPS